MSSARPLLSGRYAVVLPLDCGRGFVRAVALDATTSDNVVLAVIPKAGRDSALAAKGVLHRHLAAVLDVVDPAPEEAFPANLLPPPESVVVVAELVRGPRLGTLTAEGPIGRDRTVAWFVRLGEALRALHAAKAVHGAISSDAVVTKPTGRAIAPVLTQALAPPLIAYASPERLRGEGPSPNDDLWALGVLFHEALTGRKPFTGATPTDLLRAMQQPIGLPGLEAFEHGRELSVIARRLLDPERRRRFTTLDELLDVFERWERRTALPTAYAEATRAGAGTRPNDPVSLKEDDRLLEERPSGLDDLDVRLERAEQHRAEVLALRPREESVASGGESLRTPRDPAHLGRLQDRDQRRASLPPESFSTRLRQRPRWMSAALPWIGGLALLAGGVGVGALLRQGEGDVKTKASQMPSALPAKVPSATASALSPAAVRAEEGRCVRSYFLDGAFPDDFELDFVCRESDFLAVTRRLHDAANRGSAEGAQAGAETSSSPAAPSPSSSQGLVVVPSVVPKSWQLGWYELVATGIVQQNCCRTPPVIRLPEVPGVCPRLDAVVTRLAMDSTRAGDISPGVATFDQSLLCLMDRGLHTAYPYRAVPTKAHKAALQQFLKHAAETDARRSANR